MNEIFKVSITLFNYGKFYRIRTEKYQCKETATLYIVDYAAKRIKKSDIGVIQDKDTINDTQNIRFQVWVTNENEIDKYVEILKNKVGDKIKEFEKQLNEVKELFKTEPKIEYKCYIE